MTNKLPDAIRAALSPFAPAESEVQFTESERLEMDIAMLHEIDMAMLRDKQRDGYGQRNQDNAMRLQLRAQDNQETKT